MAQHLIYETSKYVLNFQKFKMIRCFGDSIFNGKITMSEAEKRQSNLRSNVLEFKGRAKPKAKADKNKKGTYESLNALSDSRKSVLYTFKSGIFLLKSG